MNTDPTPVTQASVLIVELLRPLVYLAGGALATAVSAWVYRKTKVDISKTLSVVVDLAIGRAEQEAFRRTGNGPYRTAPMTSEEKKEFALGFGRQLCKDRKLPGWACDELGDLIEAQLGLQKRKLTSAVTVLDDASDPVGTPGHPLSGRIA